MTSGVTRTQVTGSLQATRASSSGLQVSGDGDEVPSLVQETSSKKMKPRRLYGTSKEEHKSVKQSKPLERLGGDVVRVVGDMMVPRGEHIHFRDKDGVVGNNFLGKREC